MCSQIYTCTHVLSHTYPHAYTEAHTHMHTCLNTHMQACTQTSTHAHTRTRTHTHTHTCTPECAHTHVRTQAHAHICTHTGAHTCAHAGTRAHTWTRTEYTRAHTHAQPHLSFPGPINAVFPVLGHERHEAEWRGRPLLRHRPGHMVQGGRDRWSLAGGRGW